MSKLNKTIPPKNSEDFLGLVDENGSVYWDIFFWATKEYGVQKACYVDSELFDMPNIRGWLPLPPIDKED